MAEEIKAPFIVAPIVTKINTEGKRYKFSDQKKKDSKKSKKESGKKIRLEKLGKHIDIKI